MPDDTKFGSFFKGRTTVEMDPRDIRIAYLRSWFALDMLATFPFDIFFQFFSKTNTTETEIFGYMKISRGLKILKLMRLLRVGRLVRYLHHWEEILSMDYGTGENVIKIRD